MMSKEFLKKLGIFGVSFGLIASPLAFADFPEEEEKDQVTQEESAPETGGDSGYDSTEYENEEQETQDWEETSDSDDDFEYEDEEEEWEEPEEEEDDEESAW